MGVTAGAGESTFAAVWQRSALFASTYSEYQFPRLLGANPDGIHRSGGPGLEIICTTLATHMPVHVTLCVGQMAMYSRTLSEPGTYLLGGVPRVVPFLTNVSLQVRGLGTEEEARADREEGAGAAQGQVAAPEIVVTSTCTQKDIIVDDTLLPLLEHAGAITRPFVQRTVQTFGAETEVRFQPKGGMGCSSPCPGPDLYLAVFTCGPATVTTRVCLSARTEPFPAAHVSSSSARSAVETT